MVKGDDAVMRKRNKAKRKKLNRDNSNVSARVASIIAAKKRRQSGKRRICQGMCFTLPTPEDLFNDRHSKMEFKLNDKKKVVLPQANKKMVVKEKNSYLNKDNLSKNNKKMDNPDQINDSLTNSRAEMKNSVISNNNLGQKNPLNNRNAKARLNEKVCNNEQQANENSDCPSKFFILCLNAIEKALHREGTYNNEEKPLFVNPWGVEFLKCCSIRKDILETSGSSCTIEQIAWLVSIAADTIARKEKEGLSVNSPFLLFLVPSQAKAAKVRLLCKPLKDLGIHTVSLHPGTSLNHQIQGLKSCEPEFLVATPKRLLELVSLKAIDISGVSVLVVDGLDCLYQDGSLGTLKSIKQWISGHPNTVVFSNFYNYACITALQNVLLGSISRLSFSDSICSQSACIIQTVTVCYSEEEKHSKVIQALHGAFTRPSHCLKVLYIVENDSKSANLVKVLKINGYPVSTGSNCDLSDVENSLEADCRIKPAVSVIKAENVSTTDLSIYEIIILPDFIISIEKYVQIVTRMARHTIHGIFHSFLTEADALIAESLIKILEQCGQAVPEALMSLHLKTSMAE